MKKLLLIFIFFSVGLQAQTYSFSGTGLTNCAVGGTLTNTPCNLDYYAGNIKFASIPSLNGASLGVTVNKCAGSNASGMLYLKMSSSSNINDIVCGTTVAQSTSNVTLGTLSQTRSGFFVDLSQLFTSGTKYFTVVFITGVRSHTKTFSVTATPACNISAPNSGLASNVSTSSFRANWNAVSGAHSYTVNMTTVNGIYPGEQVTVSGTSYSFLGLEGDTQYKYQVRANCSSTLFGTFGGTLDTPTTLSPQPNLSISSNVNFGTTTLYTGNTYSGAFTVSNTGAGSWSGSMYVTLSNGITLSAGSATINANSSKLYTVSFTPTTAGTNISATAKYQTGGIGSGITVPNQSPPNLNIVGNLAISGGSVSPTTGTQNTTNFNFNVSLSNVAPSPAPAVSIEFVAPDGLVYTTSNIPNTGNNQYAKTQTLQQVGNYQYRFIAYQGSRQNAASGWNTITINVPTPITTISQPFQNHAYQRVQGNGNPGYIPVRWTTTNWTGNINMEIVRASDNQYVASLPSQANDGVYDWEIDVANVPAGEYKLLLYPAGTTGNGKYSESFKIINAPGITAPANNSQQTLFNDIPYAWNKSNPNGLATYEIRLVDATDAANPVVVFDYTNVGDVASHTPTQAYTPNHTYRWVVRSKAGVNNQYAESPPFTFTIADDPNCPNCMTGVAESDFTVTGNEGFCAAQYLCSVGIINADQSPASSSPTAILIRQDAANVLVKSILTNAQIPGYNQNPANVALPTRINVTPFDDLNNSSDPANYHQAAKVLIYLSYAEDANSITPFRKTGTNFYPGNGIARVDFLKLICESFDIRLDANAQSLPYTDIGDVHSQSLKYLKKAYQLQLISNQSLFRPYNNITREEAFLIIARVRKNYPQYIRGKEALEKNANYLFEQNVTADNVSVMRSMAAGNFAYSESGFAIPDIGFPLSFGFTYSSILTGWPEAYRKVEPLGVGWTHNFNSYILPTDRSVTPNGVQEGMALLLLANGDGTFHTFDNTNNLSPTVRSIDTFNKINVVQANGTISRYEVKRPDQVLFTYEKVNNGENIFRLVSIKDRYNNQLSLTYKAANNAANSDLKVVLDKVTAPSGRFITFQYYTDNKLYKVLFPGENSNDRELRFDYHAAWDGVGTERLQKFYNARLAGNGSGKSTRYIYGVNQQGNAAANQAAKKQIYMLEQIIRPKGNRIKVAYSNENKVEGIEEGIEGSTAKVAKTAYNRANCPAGISNCAVVTGNDGQQSTHYLNENNITYEIHDNSFIMKRPEYDANPSTPSWFEVNGLRHGYSYNGDGLILRDTTYDKNKNIKFTIRYQYDDNNNLIKFWDANANGGETDNVMSYTYSTDKKYLLNVKQRTGNNSWLTQTFQQQTNGLLDYVIDSEGLRTNFFYNNYGNVNDVHYVPLNLHSTATYDYASRVKTSTNAKNQTSQTFYDKNSNVVRTIAPAPLSYETKFRFDDNDNLIEIENAKGKITYMKYDQYDRDSVITFEGATQKYFYNNDESSPNFGRITDILKPWANRATGASPGRAFQFAYDTEGFLKSNGYITNIDYKRNGTGNSNLPDENTLMSIRGGNDPNHELDGFKYDDLVRMSEYTDHFDNKVGYNYDNNGNVKQIIYPGNNTFVTYQYDLANRLTKVIWNGVGGLRTVAEYVYANSRLDYVQYGNGVRTKYNYDGAGRLSGMSTKKTSGTGAMVAAYTFEFDNVGNHLTENITEPYEQPTLPAENISYTYNNGNQIKTMNSVTFAHDGDGNVVTKGNKTYTYDLEDNLTRITENGAEIATFTYDAFGNRRVAVRNGVETRYVLDLIGLDDVLAETNSSGMVQNYYIHGMGLVARVKADGTLYYYHGDFRGSVVAITNATQNITHQYQYDDFGKLLNEQEADSNPFKYVGLYGIMHEAPDLAYMRARYYDPETGRFNSTDPIWANNLYPYANNNGVMNVDPTGEKFQGGSVDDFLGWVNTNSYTKSHVVDAIIKNKNIEAFLLKTNPSRGLYLIGRETIMRYSQLTLYDKSGKITVSAFRRFAKHEKFLFEEVTPRLSSASKAVVNNPLVRGASKFIGYGLQAYTVYEVGKEVWYGGKIGYECDKIEYSPSVSSFSQMYNGAKAYQVLNAYKRGVYVPICPN